MHVLCRGEWALLRWGEPPDVQHLGAERGTRELWELRESRSVVFLWVTVLVVCARAWVTRVLLTKLGECGALADPSLRTCLNKCSNRTLESPPANCYFLIRPLTALISLGFASWESSPGFLIPLWLRFRALKSSVATFSVLFFNYVWFCPRNAKDHSMFLS